MRADHASAASASRLRPDPLLVAKLLDRRDNISVFWARPWRSLSVGAAPRRARGTSLGVILFVFVWIGSVTGPIECAFAQSTRPTTAAIESQPVARTRAVSTETGESGLDWSRLTMAMAVVLGLIVALKYAAAWLFPGVRVGGGGRGVRVLARTAIAPRQHVLLLQVGRRVLVVGDSGGTMSPLANIDEPDEVAELLGQVSHTSPATASGRFRAMFGRAERDYEASPEALTAADDLEAASTTPEGAAPADPNIAAAQHEISGLLDRMRSLSKSVKR